ncbi:MAG: sulfotransferase family 2 domain-containing protein [Desulfosoma sp.]
MLLSPKYKFLFVHIPKTGGTSIRVALRGYKWRDPYRIPLSLCSRLSALFGHRLACKLPRHAKAIAAKEMLPREFFDSLFKFAFVRNPWDLQVSSFHHIRRERPHLMQGFSTFEDFLKYKLDPDRPYVFHFDVSIERQSDYLVDLDGSLIVDFVGRYERFEQDFHEACQRIGIQTPRLPHKRRAADRRDYRAYYTDETAELVARHFQKDIELFGYHFDDLVKS